MYLIIEFYISRYLSQVGGRLLPDLIQLYQWLHTHLSHLVTRDRAYNKLNIGRVIHLASQRVDPTLKDLYNRVKGKAWFNEGTNHVTWSCDRYTFMMGIIIMEDGLMYNISDENMLDE